ncbi:zinc finger domain-containing protein [Streptomyces caniferus]|uniref:zinc finger domain-containing protein n=1 Tax=Streptomyces caniferus TaxID=285557 RepID=UPI00380EB98D
MDMQEVIKLLAEISLVDDRVVKTDETEQIAQVRLWAAALREVPIDFAGEAVGRHYAESAWPVMPKDIATRWRAVARDRMARHAECRAPDADPDDVGGYVLALRADRSAVVTGVKPPTRVRAELARVGRTIEPVPANPCYLAAKAAVYPKGDRPTGPTGLGVRCPTCEADTGRPCKTKAGRVMGNTHPDRQRDHFAAQQQGASA